MCGTECEISKTFSGLDAHQILQIEFDFYAGASWDASDICRLHSGTELLWSQAGRHTVADLWCGILTASSAVYGVKIFKVSIFIVHSSTSIDLKWSTTLNELPDNEWLGLHNVTLTTHNCSTGCSSCTGINSNQCTVCDGSHYFLDNSCYASCPIGYYPDSSSHCQGMNHLKIKLLLTLLVFLYIVCHTSCTTCDDSTSEDCTSCSGTLYLSDSTCVSSCPYGYYANTSDSTCKGMIVD